MFPQLFRITDLSLLPLPDSGCATARQEPEIRRCCTCTVVHTHTHDTSEG